MDPWVQWSKEIQHVETREKALWEAPIWLRTHREETLLVLLHIATHGVTGHWRPDPIMARVFLDALRLQTPEMFMPTFILDVADLAEFEGVSIPWPPALFRMLVPPPVQSNPDHVPLRPIMDDTPVDLAAAAYFPPIMDVLVDLGQSQNVHDHAVLEEATKAMQSLPASSENPGDGWRRLHSTLRGSACFDVSSQERKDALRVLDRMKSGIVHGRLGMTEEEALDRVMARIDDPINADRRDNLLETLIKSLATGVEDGEVVCSTGRIMRVVGALDGADAGELFHLKSDHVVDEEVRHLVARTRDEALTELEGKDRMGYDEDDPEVMERIRQVIRERVEREYSSVLQPAVLAQKLAPLLEHV